MEQHLTFAMTITILFDRFDTADIARAIRDSIGLMDEVILHEMGHVIGIGALWDYLLDENGDYPKNTSATAVWQKDWGCVGTPPIEKDYGPGTAYSHWDEECLLDELMTGFIGILGSGDLPDTVPLSRLTIAAVEDLGYKVNYDVANAFDGSNTPCCKTGAGAAQSTQNKPTLSDVGRDAAVTYGQNILRERQGQLPDDVAPLLEDDDTRVMNVGDKLVIVLIMEDEIIFEVFVTNNED